MSQSVRTLSNVYLFPVIKMVGFKLNKFSVDPNLFLALAVMGGDFCSEGREFESQHQILDGHYSHLFAVKFV